MAKKGEKYQELFAPKKIGNVEIKNRIVLSPLCTAYVEPTGLLGDKYIAYFTARARGGVGLIFTTPVRGKPMDESKVDYTYNNAWLYDGSHKPGWAELAENVHAWGAKIFAQLSSGSVGRQGREDQVLMAPSPIPLNISSENLPKQAMKMHKSRGLKPFFHSNMKGSIPREVTIDELKYMEDNQARTALLCKEVGIDGAEFHCCHGYFGFAMLSPRTNVRSDIYGGNFENRTRFMRNTIRKARARVGLNFPLGIRISASEHLPGGLTVEDTIEIIKVAEECGIDFVDLSNGCWEAYEWYTPSEDGKALPEAEQIKGAVKIPVICPSIHDPDLGENALRAEKTDFVGMGRQLVADPEWPNKVAEGKKFVKCIRCNIGCMTRLEMGLPIRCEVNPNVGLEYLDPKNSRIGAPFKRTYVLPWSEDK